MMEIVPVFSGTILRSICSLSFLLSVTRTFFVGSVLERARAGSSWALNKHRVACL